MLISEVSAQLRANYQECDQCGRELLQAADAVDIMEAALQKLAGLADQPIDGIVVRTIARKALETRL